MTTDVKPRIQIFGPAVLDALLKQNSDPAPRQALADGIFRLLLLQASYIANRPHRVGSIYLIAPMSDRDQTELSWNIQDNPNLGGFGGQHVLNGGLVKHEDGYWGIHT